MIKVLFVCLGNICRSPMAEFMFKDMVDKKGIGDKFYIESCGTSNEEYGNPVHRGARKKLAEYGISTDGKYARKMDRSDYDKFDYILAMENYNVRSIMGITGGDSENKVHRLLDYTDRPRDIADPWYTGNFDDTYDDLVEGLNGFLDYLKEKRLP